MNSRKPWFVASLAALVAAGGILLYRAEAPGVAAPPARAVPAAAPSTGGASVSQPATSVTPAIAAGSSAADTAPADRAYDPEQDDGQVAFKADASGHLVTDEKARLDLERLYALYTPADRARKLAEEAAKLPRDAARQLHEIAQQYENYQAAVYQVYPPGRELTTVEQGESQIDGMHGLRVQYFGEQAARGMFGEEERTQRELFRLMENEKDQSLTMEEKAQRAQEIYQEGRSRLR